MWQRRALQPHVLSSLQQGGGRGTRGGKPHPRGGGQRSTGRGGAVGCWGGGVTYDRGIHDTRGKRIKIRRWVGGWLL